MQVQARQDYVKEELESLLVIARDADIKCTELICNAVSEILKVALEQKKTEIRGGPYGNIFNNALVVAGSLGKDHEVLRNLGKEGEQRINERNQDIHDLDMKYQLASEKIGKFEFDTLIMVLKILGNSGLERALDYCSSDIQFIFRRR